MKQILVSCFILVACLLAFSYAQVATANPRVSLEPVVSNLTAVTVIRFAKPPGWSRSIMFIAEQTGIVWWFDPLTQVPVRNGTGVQLPATNIIMNISSQLLKLNAGYDERGLVGMEFHPDFSTNGRMWVLYSAPFPVLAANGSELAGNMSSSQPIMLSCGLTGLNGNASCDQALDRDHVNVLAEYRVANGVPDTNPGTATFSHMLLQVPWPFFNHNSINMLNYNVMDRRLYFGFGDGGCGYDPFENAQNLDNMHGKLMSIDVDTVENIGCPFLVQQFSALATICNPFSQALNLYAIGIRNPSGFSIFDMNKLLQEDSNSSISAAADANITFGAIVSDVGQDNVEKISVTWQSGQNFGWSLMEGTLCVNRSKYDFCFNSTVASSELLPNSSGNGTEISLPVSQLFHNSAADGSPNAILGGAMYNGTEIPALAGNYLFISLASVNASNGGGNLYMLDMAEVIRQGAWNKTFNTATCAKDPSLGIENWQNNTLAKQLVPSKIVTIDYVFAEASHYFKAIGHDQNASEFYIVADASIGVTPNSATIYRIVQAPAVPGQV